MPTRIAFLNTHPIQYYAPLYAHLNRAEDLEITALYLTDLSLRGAVDKGFGQSVTWDIDLLDGYDAQFVGEAARTRVQGGFFSLTAPEIWGLIRRARFDALVIHGHNYAAHHIALAAARSVGTAVFTRGDTHGGLVRAGLKNQVRRRVLNLHYRLVDGCLAVGSWNRAHYLAMGVPEAKIFHAPFAVDNARFAEGADLSVADRARRRAAWGVHDDRPVVLFAAKLSPRKRAGDLIEVCRRLVAQGRQMHLVIAGSGEEEAGLRRQADGLPVHFPGFLNQAELPAVYGAADIFSLPSEGEPWGLAVNEAMAAGLPVLVSAEIGAARDLVRPGENGFTHPAGDLAALTSALDQMIARPEALAGMSTASRRIIADWDYGATEAGIRQALAAC